MCIDSLGCDHASIRTASPGDVIKPTLAFKSGVLRSAETCQRGELIVSEGVLGVEPRKPVMFADRIRQGHKLFFAHAPIRLSTSFFKYVQRPSEGTLKWFSTHLVRGKEKRRTGRGVTGLPRRGPFQTITLPISWFLNLVPKSDLIGSAVQLPFSRPDVAAGLVSKKVVKIDVPITALGRRGRSAFEASNLVIPLLESLCMRATRLDERGKGMRTRESADDFAEMRESRICWLIRGITGEIVGLSTC